MRCIINLRNQGAGLPDGGLFNVNQFPKNQELEAFTAVFPERGAIEIKGTKEDIKKIAASEQVQKYWQKYGQVLVTNYSGSRICAAHLNLCLLSCSGSAMYLL